MSIQVEAPSTPKEKARVLDDAMSALVKQFDDKGLIGRLGKREAIEIDVIPTGIPALDNFVLGVGGFPRGRIIEVFGPEASGKTTIAIQVVAAAQQTGGSAAYIDVEHTFDPVYARALGADTDALIFTQPDFGEQALQIAEALIETGALDVLVVDSVAALTPKAELDGEIGDAHVGLQARMMSQAMRKLAVTVRKTNTCVILINQLRTNIGVTFGNPETTPGGRALRYAASIRLDVRRIQQVKKGDEIIGAKTKFKAAKNKVATPLRETMVDLIYGEGFDRVGSVIDEATSRGILTKSGAWLSYQGEKIANGREAVREALKKDTALFQKLFDEVLA